MYMRVGGIPCGICRGGVWRLFALRLYVDFLRRGKMILRCDSIGQDVRNADKNTG